MVFVELLCSSTVACAGDEPMSNDGAPTSGGSGASTSTSAMEGGATTPDPTADPDESGGT